MYSVDLLKNAVMHSECWSDVCRKLNVTICTFNFKRMRRLCNDNNIAFSHFNIKKTFRRGKKQWRNEDIYCEKSLYPRHYLRRKIIADKILNYCCNSCGNEGTWNGKKLILEVEHINGINDDNRKQNLSFLCPNCHSQTPTYRNSKNRQGLVA